MAVRLFKLGGHRNQIAVSGISASVTGGTFFLDFSRPLESHASPFGRVISLLVPVVHQGEHNGGYIIGVHRNDPAFKELRRLWKQRYPTQRTPQSQTADILQITADFARQFPNDC